MATLRSPLLTSRAKSPTRVPLPSLKRYTSRPSPAVSAVGRQTGVGLWTSRPTLAVAAGGLSEAIRACVPDVDLASDSCWRGRDDAMLILSSAAEVRAYHPARRCHRCP